MDIVVRCTALLSFIALPTVRANSFKLQCEQFNPEIHVFNTTRTQLEYISAGSNLTFPDNDPTCGRSSQIVAANLCRVALSIPTSNRSSITFELWLPQDWSGRFMATGNGGIDGCIKYEDLAYTAQNGFAVVGANNGHNGTYGNAFYQNPDVVTDFAWRSLHTSVTIGKKLVDKFYEEEHKKSYYLGCSLGGRQGIKSAEMFPHDFDGIIAGSPGVDFNHLIAWRARFLTITGAKGSANFITPQTWNTTIHKEVLRQCDAIDGTTDGIIEDPALCEFKPDALACKGDDVTDCLNPAQVEIVRQIFRPFLGPNGELIYPAMQPGSETMAIQRLYAGVPFSYSEDWYKYVINDPSWNASNFNVGDALKADAVNPANIRTWPSSLADFQAAGGKMIMYHGQQDQQISSFNSPRFYEHVREGMEYDYEKMDKFLRFFRISGMFHCSGGPGAWVFGQGGKSAAEGIPFNKENNVLASIVEWVEHGAAPETLVGTKFVEDQVDLGIAMTRRHCKWPLRNRFLGGEPSNTNSWECKYTNSGPRM